MLRALREQGVCIAIDDFGAGYSSLGRLAEVELDVLKIDRSLISRFPQGPRRAAVFQTIIGLAARLRLNSVAEGIESEAQLNSLRKTRCRLVQGYYIGPPMEAACLGSWRQRWLRSIQSWVPLPSGADLIGPLPQGTGEA